jgi:hypothetical protein
MVAGYLQLLYLPSYAYIVTDWVRFFSSSFLLPFWQPDSKGLANDTLAFPLRVQSDECVPSP